MTQITIETTHTLSTQTKSFISFKNEYKKFTQSIRKAKQDKKQAQRDENAVAIHSNERLLSYACLMYVYYMLIAKSEQKLIKAFSNNPVLLKGQLDSILRVLSSSAKRNETLCEWYGITETHCLFNFLTQLNMDEMKERIKEKATHCLALIVD